MIMDAKDFGKLTLLINEYVGLRGVVTIGNVSGELRILYADVNQSITPEDLRLVLVSKGNEYIAEKVALQEARDKEDEVSLKERNLDIKYHYVDRAGFQLTLLTEFQAANGCKEL